MQHLRHRHSLSGRSIAPLLIIIAGLAVSAFIFFKYTRPQIAAKNAEAAAQGAPSAAAPTVPAGSTPGATAPTGDPKSAASIMRAPGETTPANPAAPTAPTTPALPGFARPLDLGTQLARAIETGDFSMAGKLAAGADPTQSLGAEAVMKKIFGEMGYKTGPQDKIEIVGQVGDYMRLSVPLMKSGETTPALRLQLDVERDAKMGWKIAQIHLPRELAVAIAAMPPAATPDVAMTPGGSAIPTPAQPGAAGATPGKPAAAPSKPAALFTIVEKQDSLSFASDFVSALLRHDFAEARKFIDEEKVPKEKLAGLCIVFEEGQYALKPSKPLIITVANPEVAWVIGQVQSEKLQETTEFGLELQRAAVDQDWKIVGLNLSEILGSFAQSAAKLGVPYTPIVKNPKGGESLALYFEYDSADLHPRAQKQLEIVAGLLKSDASKKLKIAGHTDAMGAEDYNISLSQRRAEEVKKRLAALGVSAGQVVTEALGKTQPLSPNYKADGTDDPEGRSKNRRAEIYLDF
jgi:outer membrane protein OmpA-like peptidoglycan-associated protein